MDPHFDGVIFQTHPAELARRMRSPRPPFLVVDVRAASEQARGTIPGAVAVSSTDLAALPGGADAKTEFIVVGGDLEDPEVRRTTCGSRSWARIAWSSSPVVCSSGSSSASRSPALRGELRRHEAAA